MENVAVDVAPGRKTVDARPYNLGPQEAYAVARHVVALTGSLHHILENIAHEMRFGLFHASDFELREYT